MMQRVHASRGCDRRPAVRSRVLWCGGLAGCAAYWTGRRPI